MADPIVIPQRAPYVMDMEAGTYYWCQCGRSKTQPFCDGSHTGTDLSPIEVEIKEKKESGLVWLQTQQKIPIL